MSDNEVTIQEEGKAEPSLIKGNPVIKFALSMQDEGKKLQITKMADDKGAAFRYVTPHSVSLFLSLSLSLTSPFAKWSICVAGKKAKVTTKDRRSAREMVFDPPLPQV